MVWGIPPQTQTRACQTQTGKKPRDNADFPWFLYSQDPLFCFYCPLRS